MEMESSNPAVQRLHDLKNIPINTPYIARMINTLTEHGALFMETLDKTQSSYTGSRHGYKEFTIVFPEGTMRVDGDIVKHTTPFRIVFPDGFEVRGRSIYPGHRGPTDPETIILYVPSQPPLPS